MARWRGTVRSMYRQLSVPCQLREAPKQESSKLSSWIAWGRPECWTTGRRRMRSYFAASPAAGSNRWNVQFVGELRRRPSFVSRAGAERNPCHASPSPHGAQEPFASWAINAPMSHFTFALCVPRPSARSPAAATALYALGLGQRQGEASPGSGAGRRSWCFGARGREDGQPPARRSDPRSRLGRHLSGQTTSVVGFRPTPWLWLDYVRNQIEIGPGGARTPRGPAETYQEGPAGAGLLWCSSRSSGSLTAAARRS